MSYCAVCVKSESGDSYVFLIKYEKREDVSKYLFNTMGEEMQYVYEAIVDTEQGREESDKITQEIYNFIEGMEEE